MVAWVVLAFLVVFLAFLVGIYNGLVRLKNQVANGFAQVEVQLKRRHDLIPALMQVAQQYMGHEEEVLRTVTQARNLAKSTSIQEDGLNGVAQAEQKLSAALAQFYAVAENYPQLQADRLMQQTMDEITNTENRIGFARQHYNDSVMFYNNQREVFPNNILSGFFRFERLSYLEFKDKSVLENTPVITMNA